MFSHTDSLIVRTLLIATLLLTGGCSIFKEESDITTKWSAEKLYTEAKRELDNGDYETAIDYLEKLEGRYPYGRYAQQAQLDAAYAYYRDDQPELAMAAAERFIHLHPAHPSVDYAYYLKGLIAFKIKRGALDFMLRKQDYADRNPDAMQKAYDAFLDLVERYPNSRYATDARKRMVYLHNLLAKHEVAVARYYYTRGAYVATVNRSKQVLEKYARTPAVEDALGLQMKAYHKMGLPRLASDSRRVLQKNFPGSAWLKQDEGVGSSG